jgi:hypothetical protein
MSMWVDWVLGTWEIALDRCGIEVVCLFETLAVGMVEGVEVDAAVCGCEGEEEGKDGEEVHCYALVGGYTGIGGWERAEWD